jgi:hypothetical protein
MNERTRDEVWAQCALLGPWAVGSQEVEVYEGAGTGAGTPGGLDALMLVTPVMTPEGGKYDAAELDTVSVGGAFLMSVIQQQAAELAELRGTLEGARGVLTGIAHLHTNSPLTPAENYAGVVQLVEAWTEAQGCHDCVGQTWEDGTVCCWTCGRVLPGAEAVTDA